MKKPHEIENLNLEDLDVQELEKRLEMSALQASEAGWIDTCPDKGQCPGLVQCPELDQDPFPLPDCPTDF